MNPQLPWVRHHLPILLSGILFIPTAPLRADDGEKSVNVASTATTVSQVRDASETVVRSAADLKEAALDPLLSTTLKLPEVDFEKQMVVVIRSGMTNAFGVNLSLLSTAIADGKLTVNWQFKPYFGGAAPPDQPGNPTLVAVLDRFGGEVKFERTNWTYPEGLPLPPSAPPGGGIPPKLDPQ